MLIPPPPPCALQNHPIFEHHENWGQNKWKPALFVSTFVGIGLFVPWFGISFAQCARAAPTPAPRTARAEQRARAPAGASRAVPRRCGARARAQVEVAPVSAGGVPTSAAPLSAPAPAAEPRRARRHPGGWAARRAGPQLRQLRASRLAEGGPGGPPCRTPRPVGPDGPRAATPRRPPEGKARHAVCPLGDDGVTGRRL